MTEESAIRSLRFSAIDFESAGASRGRTDVPVQVGIASGPPDGGATDLFDSYLSTDQRITWAARRVHGITDADCAAAPRLHQLWPEVRARLAGHVVVAHGKGTEKRFLRAFPGHGFGPWVDTLLVTRAVWPEASSHQLEALCQQAGLTSRIAAEVPGRTWHDALFDAVASLILLRHLLTELELLDVPLAVLLRPDQSAWSRNRR